MNTTPPMNYIVHAQKQCTRLYTRDMSHAQDVRMHVLHVMTVDWLQGGVVFM